MNPEIVGLAAGAVGFMQVFPQLLRVRSRGTVRGVSLATWLMFIASHASWMGYGIRTHSVSQIVANAGGALWVSYLVGQIIKDRIKAFISVSLTVVSMALLVVNVPFAIMNLILAAFSLSRVPQVVRSITTWRNSHESDVSVLTWAISFTSTSLWLIYSLIDARPIVTFTSLVSLLASFVICFTEIAAAKRFQKTLI